MVISLSSEKTATTVIFLAAVSAAPVVVAKAIILPAIVFPPLIVLLLPTAVLSVWIGFYPYLMLAGPPMALAHFFGFNHPIWHGCIGIIAVAALPMVEGLAHMPGPDAAEPGFWFGPVWCALSAAFFNALRRSGKGVTCHA